jgi:serine/threonine-protein kinase HipA
MKITNCPGCLRNGYESYCNSCIQKLFNNQKVSHILNFTRPEFNKIKREKSGRLSISGIQIKHSVQLINKELVLSEEKGEYILKPIPTGSFENLDQVPANEHLTMQIANQVYNRNVADNGIVFFKDGEIAYLTKRFDIISARKNFLQEDFAQIANRTEETHGKNYKYEFLIEVEKYFKLIIFNYLFSNGDAHLKNFSLYRNEEYGDYLLTSFYDLLNTSIHVPGESDLALELFKDAFTTASYKAGSKYTKPDFEVFAGRLDINEKRFNKIYNEMLTETNKVKEFVFKSFLNDEIKEIYFQNYLDRLERLKS